MTVDIDRLTVRLGVRDFELQTPGFKRARPWKKRLIDEIKPLFEQIGGMQNIAIDTPADLLKLTGVLELVFLDSIGQVLELLIAFSPDLEIERDYIEENATDKQILVAFQAAVKLADPFGVVSLMTRKYGLATNGTS